MKNSLGMLFPNIAVGKDEAAFVTQFLNDHDLAPESRKAITCDIRKFARWFSTANQEPFAQRGHIRQRRDSQPRGG